MGLLVDYVQEKLAEEPVISTPSPAPTDGVVEPQKPAAPAPEPAPTAVVTPTPEPGGAVGNTPTPDTTPAPAEQLVGQPGDSTPPETPPAAPEAPQAPAPALPEAPAEPSAPTFVADDDLRKQVVIKIDGQEMTLTLAEAIKEVQLSKASYARMEEAAALKKRAEAVIQGIKQDPIETMRQIFRGHFGDSTRARTVVRQILEDALTKELQEESLPPEAKTFLAEKRRLEEEAADLRAQLAERDARAQAAAEVGAQNSVQQEIGQAIQAAGLPLFKEVIQGVAQEILGAQRRGAHIPPRHAAEIVRAKRERQFQTDRTTVPMDRLLLLYPERANDLRASIQAKSRPTPTKPVTAPSATKTERREPAAKPRIQSVQEFRKFLQSRI